MNVLVFTSLFPNHVHVGHGIFIKERISRFSRGPGRHVRVVAPVPYFPPIRLTHRAEYSEIAARERIDGLEVHHPRYLVTPKLGMSFYGWLMFRSVLPTVRRLQREQDFDLIDAHYVYPDGLAAVLLGRKLGKPVVVSARGSDINRYVEMPLIRGLVRRTLQRAGSVIAVSEALKRKMVALGVPDERVAVIPNGVDAEKFRPMPRERARAELQLPPGKIVLFVGHLDLVKGVDRLIEAFAALRAQASMQDVKLYMIGYGSYRQQLEQEIERLGLLDSAVLVGTRPHEDLHRWFSAADVLCLPSRREGWPNVLLEALACGTPIVATRVGGIPEIVSSPDLGVLTEASSTALAEGLSRALRTSWSPETLRGHAESFSWDRAAAAMAEVFESTLRGRNGARPVGP